MIKGGKEVILTINAALRPVLWTSLDTTTILLHKSEKKDKLWFTKAVGGSMLEETEPCGEEGGEKWHVGWVIVKAKYI